MPVITWFLVVCTSGLGGAGMACTPAQPVQTEAGCEAVAKEYSIAVSGSGRMIYRCFKRDIDVDALPVDPN